MTLLSLLLDTFMTLLPTSRFIYVYLHKYVNKYNVINKDNVILCLFYLPTSIYLCLNN